MTDDYFVVYILYSKTFDKTYVGYTQDLIDRFYSHNKLATKGYTIRYRPWEVMHLDFYKTKYEAMNREKYYKSGIGRSEIKILKMNYLNMKL
ncbi:GIY-YIG nuclease family protein [Paucihalobacter ruber]|uniref:GIY-YIG nuclease family protein n=1 Tax=Paucihalobacter ruber TaxID=2567861 RepID=A0A506PPH9_9FLAO|nr:GIY-YIG nuclease family protein [Paucihalobacter ruber]TPV35614.1 GIY-YIG nuclease family protein [Paucihalobacter ruber]